MEVKAFFVIEYVFGTDNNHVYHKIVYKTYFHAVTENLFRSLLRSINFFKLSITRYLILTHKYILG